jgi:hypothetical protein
LTYAGYAIFLTPIAPPGAVPRNPDTVDPEVARTIGGLLRGVRRAAGYRAVRDATAAAACPAAPQTICSYERGGLVPSLRQFLDLVDFYALGRPAPAEARYRAIGAIHAALASPAYQVPRALDLIRRLQPPPDPGHRRRKE